MINLGKCLGTGLMLVGLSMAGMASAATYRVENIQFSIGSSVRADLGINTTDKLSVEFTIDEANPFAESEIDQLSFAARHAAYRVTAFSGQIGAVSFSAINPTGLRNRLYVNDGIEERTSQPRDSFKLEMFETIDIGSGYSLGLMTMEFSEPGTEAFDSLLPSGDELSAMVIQRFEMNITDADGWRRTLRGSGGVEPFVVTRLDGGDDVSAVPVPAGMALMLTGVFGLGLAGRFRKKGEPA